MITEEIKKLSLLLKNKDLDPKVRVSIENRIKTLSNQEITLK